MKRARWLSQLVRLLIAGGLGLFVIGSSAALAATQTESGKLGVGFTVVHTPTPTPSPTLSPTVSPTLTPSVSPTASASPQPQPTGGVISQIGQFVAQVFNQIGKAVTVTIAAIAAGLAPAIQQAGKFIKLTPPIVAQNFPWLLLLYLLLLIMLHLRQAIREQREAAAILKVMEREQVLAGEKDNFIMLTSHHLRTWVTYIKNGVDLISINKAIDPALIASLKQGAGDISSKVEELLKTINEKTTLQEIAAPNIKQARQRLYTSPFLIGPLVTVGVISVVAYFIFANIAHIQESQINQLIQLLAYIVEGSILYLVLRSRLQRRNKVQNSLQLLAHQRAIDQARNQFIQDSVVIVGGALQAYGDDVANIQSNEQAKYIVNGYKKLIDLIAKFQLAVQVEGGQLGHALQHFGLRQLIDKSMASHQEAAAGKKIQLSAAGNDGPLIQNQDTLQLVVDSLVDNAIKFSPEGGKVSVAYDYAGAKTSVTVTDSGAGMTQEQVDQLFQPFTRTESALVFSYEGLGFSLFLDRLLMKYMEGDVQVKSQPSLGTSVTATLSSDMSGRETIVIAPEKVKPPRVKISMALVAFSVALVAAVLLLLYLTRFGFLGGLLGSTIWTLMGFASVFVVGSWLAIVFGIIEPDSRRRT